jgi:transposase
LPGSIAMAENFSIHSNRVNLRAMPPIPRLTSGEWRQIAPILPPGKQMRSRHRDRDVVTALLYAEAARCSLELVPAQYGIGFRSLSTRRLRWRADGTWPRLLEAGEPAIVRMRRELVDPEDLLERCARVFGWDLR